jgi:hypothetical protein
VLADKERDPLLTADPDTAVVLEDETDIDPCFTILADTVRPVDDATVADAST